MAHTCNCIVAHRITEERTKEIAKVSASVTSCMAASCMANPNEPVIKAGVLCAGSAVGGEDQAIGRTGDQG